MSPSEPLHLEPVIRLLDLHPLLIPTVLVFLGRLLEARVIRLDA